MVRRSFGKPFRRRQRRELVARGQGRAGDLPPTPAQGRRFGDNGACGPGGGEQVLRLKGGVQF